MDPYVIVHIKFTEILHVQDTYIFKDIFRSLFALKSKKPFLSKPGTTEAMKMPHRNWGQGGIAEISEI